MKIPITKPVFGTEEMEAIQQPLVSGWVVQGPFVKDFETKFARYIQVRYASATTSCTTALHIGVAAFGLQPGDEVIVPAFTWISTANVMEFMGAKPVFCDIDLRTFNIDPEKIEALITHRTVGIIPVHLFGLCANMEPIRSIARKRGLWVLEDAACGLGGWYKGNHAGTLGDAGAFSFHPRKSITTGEGGMLTTNNAEIARQAEILRDHGASRTDLTRHEGRKAFLLTEYECLGYNYRMTDIQGALGSAQMDRVDWILQKRREWAKRYDEQLKDRSWLDIPHVPDGCVHSYQSYVCLFRPEEPSLDNVDRLHERRNALMEKLESQGIATRQGTHAPAMLDFYRSKYGYKASDFPNAWLADRLSVSLPLYATMTEEEHAYVCSNLKSA